MASSSPRHNEPSLEEGPENPILADNEEDIHKLESSLFTTHLVNQAGSIKDSAESLMGGSSLSSAARDRQLAGSEDGPTAIAAAAVVSSSSSLLGGTIHVVGEKRVKPPGYAKERMLRHIIAARLAPIPFILKVVSIQVLVDGEGHLPD